MTATQPRVKGSVLDRLLDDTARDQARPFRVLQTAVRRDLEPLLNARRPWSALPVRFERLRDSILGYGLPDFAAGAFNAPAQRDALCMEIAQIIQRFEPRLNNVTVTLLDRKDKMDPVLRVQVRAALLTETSEEPVGFETLLDTTTAELIVRPAARV